MSTLATTRVASGATISSTTENNNQAAVEAVVNGGIEAANIAADAVTAAKLNSDVVNANNGLKQETDGSLSVDPSDTNPCLEITDGGVRAKVDDSTIERASGGLQLKDSGITAAKIASGALAAAYPVGSIYMNASVSTNPATLLGFGTWTAFGAGRVLVGLNSGDSDFDTVQETGGSKTHTLTSDEMPAHTHTFPLGGNDFDGGIASNGSNNNATETTASTGGGSAHNNLQPYIVVYMWLRTA